MGLSRGRGGARDELLKRTERVLRDHDRKGRSQKQCEVFVVLLHDPHQTALSEAGEDFLHPAEVGPLSVRPVFVDLQDLLALDLHLAELFGLESSEGLFVVEAQHQQKQAFVELHALTGRKFGGHQADVAVNRSAHDAIAERVEQILEITHVPPQRLIGVLHAPIVLIDELGAPKLLCCLAQILLQLVAVAAFGVFVVDEFRKITQHRQWSSFARSGRR